LSTHSEAAELLEKLYREAGQQLVLAAYALTGDVSDAQEAVQDAFVRSLVRPAKVLRADNPIGWMRVVTLNIARDRQRRRRRLAVLTRRLPDPVAVLPELDPDRVALKTAIWRLPAVQREAIALFYFADLGVDDIAAALGTPVNTIKTRLRRGRFALAEQLHDRNGGETAEDPTELASGRQQ
jgi:RNA polymerase sigma-70 factor (ECF subfamily)